MPKKRAKRPLTDVLAAARRNRYKVIHERNLLILALAKHAGFAVHLVKVDDKKLSEPDEWDKVLCLHTPAGQLHWKLSPVDQKEFSSLKTLRKSDYDGAKAIEKSVRLEGLHTLPSAVEALQQRIYELEAFIAQGKQIAPDWTTQLATPTNAVDPIAQDRER